MTTLCTVYNSNRVMSSARVTMAVNVLQLHCAQMGTENRFAWDARWSDIVVATHRNSTGPSSSEPSIADTPVTIESMESEPAESQTKTGQVLELFGATWGRSGGPKETAVSSQLMSEAVDGNVQLGRVLPFTKRTSTGESKSVGEEQSLTNIVGVPNFDWMAGHFNRNRGAARQSLNRGFMSRMHGMRSSQSFPSVADELGDSGERGKVLRLSLGLRYPPAVRI